MRSVAVVEPTTLIGQSVRERLEADPTHELRLFAAETEAFGTLTEIRGEAAVVTPLSAGSLAGVDVALLCGSAAQQAAALELIPGGVRAIQVATDLEPRPGTPRVAGVGDSAAGEGTLISPHPAVVLLSHLLNAVDSLAPRRVSGTLLLPASEHGGEGIEELFEQTRSLLNFSGESPQRIFGRQLAFNLFSTGDSAALGTRLREVLPIEVELAIRMLQGPVFHGIAANLWVETTAAVDDSAIREALAGSPYFEAVEDASGPSPVDAAHSDRILFARNDDGASGRQGLWMVMDNLGRGGADNVVDLLDIVLPPAADA